MAEKKEIKTIAFVYSGGLSRGSIQLGFASEIIKKVGYDRILMISSSSIGALNSYATSVHNVDALLKFYSNIDCDSTKHFMRKIRNDLFNEVFNEIEGEKMSIPAYVTGTRVFGLTCDYFCLNKMPREDIKNAINMSMSFPIINGPLKFNRRYYIDGGATDNVPVLPVTYFDPDMVIILHNYPKYYPPGDLYNKLPNAVIVDVDVTLTLPKSFTSYSLAKNEFREMIRVGKEKGKEFSDFIFQDFDKEKVRERCHQYIDQNMEARRAKSGDGLMSFVDVINALYRIKENIV